MGQSGERNGIPASKLLLNEYLLVQLDAELIELLAQNLSRLDEESEVDRAGVYYVLSELSQTRHAIGILLLWRRFGKYRITDVYRREDWARPQPVTLAYRSDTKEGEASVPKSTICSRDTRHSTTIHS